MQLILKNGILIIFLVVFQTLSSQVNKRVLYDSLKTFTYRAIFINTLGDTLSNETILYCPTGTTWKFDEKQDLVRIYYDTDLTTLGRIKNPMRKRKPLSLSVRESTGLIENETHIWIHPFRSNQYCYTEIAPFPTVELDKLKLGSVWDGGTTFILFGWHRFKGNVKSTYEVTEYSQISLFNETLDYWRVKGVGVHNKLGTSTINFTYNPKYGFLTIDYLFYDGTRISFCLEKSEKNE